MNLDLPCHIIDFKIVLKGRGGVITFSDTPLFYSVLYAVILSHLLLICYDGLHREPQNIQDETLFKWVLRHVVG